MYRCTTGHDGDNGRCDATNLDWIRDLQKEHCQTFQIQFFCNCNRVWYGWISAWNWYLKSFFSQEMSYPTQLSNWCRSTLTRLPLTTSRETRRSRRRPSWVLLEAPWDSSLVFPSSVGLRSSSFSWGHLTCWFLVPTTITQMFPGWSAPSGLKEPMFGLWWNPNFKTVKRRS